MTALWLGIIVIACLVSIAAGVWLLVLAFRENVGWGLACLFIPFAALAFVLKFWDEAKKPFLYSLAGSGLAIIGMVGYSVSTVNADLGTYSDLSGSMSSDNRPLSAAFDVEPSYNPDPLESEDSEPVGGSEPIDDAEPVNDAGPEELEIDLESFEIDDPPSPQPEAEDQPRRSYAQDKTVVIPVSRLHTMVGEVVRLELSTGQRMAVRVEAIDDHTARVRHRVGGGSVAYTIDLDHIVEVRVRKEK